MSLGSVNRSFGTCLFLLSCGGSGPTPAERDHSSGPAPTSAHAAEADPRPPAGAEPGPRRSPPWEEFAVEEVCHRPSSNGRDSFEVIGPCSCGERIECDVEVIEQSPTRIALRVRGYLDQSSLAACDECYTTTGSCAVPPVSAGARVELVLGDTGTVLELATDPQGRLTGRDCAAPSSGTGN